MLGLRFPLGAVHGGARGPALSFDFATPGASLDSRITFTRASSSLRYNASGLLESVSSGTPRFDYDPLTRALRGLLIEESRTNLLLRSAMDATGSFWNDAAGGANTTITGGTASAPNGATDAGTLAAASTGTFRSVLQFVTVAASTTYTFSIFAKAGSGVNIAARLQIGASAYSGAIFNPSTGAVVAQTDGTAATTSVQQLPNGWWRFSVTATTAAGFTASAALVYLSNGSSLGNTVTVGSNAYVWGAQLEAGAFPASYIPTTSATVTRAADVTTMLTSAFPFNAAAGTLVVRGASFATDSVQRRIVSLNDGTTSNFIDISRFGNSQQARAQVVVGGANQSSPLTSSWPTNTMAGVAHAFQQDDFAACLSGGTVATDVSGTIPTVTTLRLGDITGSNNWCGWINSLQYFPRRLSNAELQARSA